MMLVVGVAAMVTGFGSTSTDVNFKGAGGVSLVGTLEMPSAAPPDSGAPAVLLIPGSGPTDRDGNQPPQVTTNVLKQLADALAAKGIASLRFDKRACHVYLATILKVPAADRSEYFKWENFVDDATAAFRFLQSQKGIDKSRVGLIGHSEGAEISLQIGSNLAHADAPPATIVTIGGAGRPMGIILHEQIERSLKKQKNPASMIEKYLAYTDAATAQIVAKGTFPADPPPGLNVLFNDTTAKIMRSYCSIDPSELAKNFNGPVLIVNGAHDTQISAERDAPKLKAALESRSSGTVEMFIVPDASHCLKQTTATTDDVFDGPIVPAAMDAITGFLVKQLKP